MIGNSDVAGCELVVTRMTELGAAHGYEPTREAGLAGLAKSWKRQ